MAFPGVTPSAQAMQDQLAPTRKRRGDMISMIKCDTVGKSRACRTRKPVSCGCVLDGELI